VFEAPNNCINDMFLYIKTTNGLKRERKENTVSVGVDVIARVQNGHDIYLLVKRVEFEKMLETYG
jgi:hypothetical protein